MLVEGGYGKQIRYISHKCNTACFLVPKNSILMAEFSTMLTMSNVKQSMRDGRITHIKAIHYRPRG